jgi:hypothetical protein
VESAWWATSGSGIDHDLILWPPDVFALTDALLARSEAYRFVVSPPPGKEWSALRDPGWGERITSAARDWCLWVDDPDSPAPEIVADEWAVLQDGASAPLESVASGEDWRLCEALLTLHAIADQACARVAVRPNGDDRRQGDYDARVRELLSKTGSMATIDPARLRVLPRYRTAPGGISIRSISRYAFVTGPNVEVAIHQPSPQPGPLGAGELNLLLLPWPLSISAGDFRPLPGSVHRRDVEPFGYFEFVPAERFDFTLAESLITAAKKNVDRVDMVVLPEGSITEDDLPRLEEVMSRHGIDMLVAGVRSRRPNDHGFGTNWVELATGFNGTWSHFRQEKHHRWSLDQHQIEQYHLEDVLNPAVRWWEAMELPQRSLQIIERPDGHTIASLVCEDLAQIDDTIDLIRATGPTLVLPLLLDGPQLSSRWTSRYAAILSDDPGSAVLTLSSYGMVRRSTPPGHTPSSTVALWRDRTSGTHEITLASDTQAVLLTASSVPAVRRAADGRRPEADVSELTLARTTQLTVRPPGQSSPKRSEPHITAPAPSSAGPATWAGR